MGFITCDKLASVARVNFVLRRSVRVFLIRLSRRRENANQARVLTWVLTVARSPFQQRSESILLLLLLYDTCRRRDVNVFCSFHTFFGVLRFFFFFCFFGFLFFIFLYITLLLLKTIHVRTIKNQYCKLSCRAIRVLIRGINRFNGKYLLVRDNQIYKTK